MYYDVELVTLELAAYAGILTLESETGRLVARTASQMTIVIRLRLLLSAGRIQIDVYR